MNSDWQKKVDAYVWVPKARRHYGSIAFTATQAACAELSSAVSSVASGSVKRRSFEFRQVAESDLDTIGGGARWSATTFRITPADRQEEHLLVFMDESESLVEIAVNPVSAKVLLRVLQDVASGSGDQDVPVTIAGKEGRLMYWPCFGRSNKVKEPAEGSDD